MFSNKKQNKDSNGNIGSHGNGGKQGVGQFYGAYVGTPQVVSRGQGAVSHYVANGGTVQIYDGAGNKQVSTRPNSSKNRKQEKQKSNKKQKASKVERYLELDNKQNLGY